MSLGKGLPHFRGRGERREGLTADDLQKPLREGEGGGERGKSVHFLEDSL